MSDLNTRRTRTVKECAQALGLSTQKVRQLIHERRLRAELFGNRYRIPAAALDEFLERMGAET